jgi:hypothetical protein
MQEAVFLIEWFQQDDLEAMLENLQQSKGIREVRFVMDNRVSRKL